MFANCCTTKPLNFKSMQEKLNQWIVEGNEQEKKMVKPFGNVTLHFTFLYTNAR